MTVRICDTSPGPAAMNSPFDLEACQSCDALPNNSQSEAPLLPNCQSYPFLQPIIFIFCSPVLIPCFTPKGAALLATLQGHCIAVMYLPVVYLTFPMSFARSQEQMCEREIGREGE